MNETIGFIGLGNMGLPMAANLLQAGYALRVYNRNAARASELVQRGAVLAEKPGETAGTGGIVITMLSDDRALDEIAMGGDELARHLGRGGVHVSMSTVSPAISRRVSEHHKRHGISYVGAPVFGRPEAAAARKLWICVSGAQHAKERIRPVLEVLGQGIFDFGEDPGAAHVVKLAGNFMLASAVEAMAEAMTLAAKNGIEPARIVEVMGQTLFACPVYQNYGRALAARQYEPPGFRLSLGLKDVDLVLKTAAGAKVPMPLASLLHDRMMAGVARGHGDLDWAVIGREVAEQAGLPE
jgi:3-hydroxyisobutyrate dehydrogenase-like beta-hydroxyacid dehydrogenase